MHKYSNVYSGEEPPKDKSVLWLHHETKNDVSSPRIAEIFNKGKWVPISLSDSSGSGDTPTDIQIVELTYDHLPATGTLSASDLAKLDGDNCLLIINGKYFYKTFSANIGFDYHEIASANVLGGVRSIYFTASKPDGEYTIAYTYSVEANTQTQANAALENIKVGNTTYSVPLSPMIVEGTVSEEAFTPSEGAPTWEEAQEQMFNGGLVYLMGTSDGEPIVVCLATEANPLVIVASTSDGFFFWDKPSADPGDGPFM